jgi:hypothetical protein
MAQPILAFGSRARLPFGLNVRLDRLARRAHAFHRFAHHPLCDRYAGELIVLRGRTRICRGCCYAAIGSLLGVLLGACLSVPSWPLALVSSLVFAAVIRPEAGSRGTCGAGPAAAAVTNPQAFALAEPRSAPRIGSSHSLAPATKLATRALPLLLMAAALSAALRELRHGVSFLALAALGVTLSATLRAHARYRARGPDRTPCASCPERACATPCSGVRPIIRAERAFVRRAQQLIDHDAQPRVRVS